MNPKLYQTVLGLWSVLLATIGLLYLYTPTPNYTPKKILAKTFLLTDYCLSTESRHTRHIALPELIAPFQDLPAYHDHFPSSSFLHRVVTLPDSTK